MKTRTLLAVLALAVGIALAVVSYLFLAAPLGRPTAESFSNPRLPFAAGLFVLGVVMVFLSAIIYELLPDCRSQPQPVARQTGSR